MRIARLGACKKAKVGIRQRLAEEPRCLLKGVRLCGWTGRICRIRFKNMQIPERAKCLDFIIKGEDVWAVQARFII